MQPDYMARLQVYDAQQDAIKTNRAAHDMYRDHIAPDWIARNVQNRNIGLAIETPQFHRWRLLWPTMEP
jgi:hypothetical protein